MDPTPSHKPHGVNPAPTGELVVQNGRMSGARCPLSAAATLIGRAEGCDVRLTVDGVEPHHCLLLPTAGGLMLRDLSGATGTLVNGELTVLRILADGDLLTVGPFRFRVRLPAPQPASLVETDFVEAVALPEPEELQHEKDALHIQAAAVVAQQAALTEEEGRLDQRRLALQRQEEQLASHLEEKRGRLIELQDQVRQARAALRQERAEHTERGGKMRLDLDRTRRELQTSQQKVHVERQRLGALRRRLRQRWHRHWDIENARIQRLETELTAGRQHLEKETEQVIREREALAQERRRFNGEIELGRRQVQDSRDQLRREQTQFQELRTTAQAELKKRLRDVEQRESALEAARREFAEVQRHAEAARARVEQEAEGLENRIRNQRRRLAELEAEVARLDALRARAQHGNPAPALPPAAVAAPPVLLPPVTEENQSGGRRLAALERLAGELADQRLYLAEQGRRLLEARAGWQQEHDAASDELEALAHRLETREQAVEDRERAQATAEDALQQLHQETECQRAQVEARQVRVAAREQEWEGERDRLLIQLRNREERARHQSAGVLELRRRWLQHRRQEVERLRTEHQRCEELRARYAALWEECLSRRAGLEQEQRALAEKALAMEQYRMECVGRAENSAAADRRLERLRRRIVAISVAAARKLEEDRRVLDAESARLNQWAHDLAQFQAGLIDRDAEFTTRKTAWEEEQRLVDNANAKLHHELRGIHAIRRQLERQVKELNNELERVVHAILEPSRGNEMPQARAA